MYPHWKSGNITGKLALNSWTEHVHTDLRKFRVYLACRAPSYSIVCHQFDATIGHCVAVLHPSNSKRSGASATGFSIWPTNNHKLSCKSLVADWRQALGLVFCRVKLSDTGEPGRARRRSTWESFFCVRHHSSLHQSSPCCMYRPQGTTN